MKLHSTIFKIVHNYIIIFFLFFFLKSFGEKILVKSVKLLLLSIKSRNPIQRYPHVTKLYACIISILICMFL